MKKQTLLDRLKYFAAVGILIAAGFLVVFALIANIQDQKQQQALDEQTKKTSELIEQVKTLTEENKKTSQQAANYAYCNAVILAQYTQNYSPISIKDLNTCVLESFPNSTIVTPKASSITSGSNSNQSTTPTPTQNNSQSNAQNNNNVGTTPTNVLPGLQIELPCVSALGLLAISCR